ncbi:MAG: metallophosphoesterase [Bacteroidales bacterium]
MGLRLLAIIILILAVDSLLYLLFIRVFANIFLRKTFMLIHLGLITAFFIFSLGVVLFNGNPGEDFRLYRNYFLWMDTFILIYLPKLVLLITLAPLLIFRFGRRPGRMQKASHHLELRRKYIWIAGAFFFTLLFFFIIFDGLVRGPVKFRVKVVNLSCEGLPKGFDGFKIAHFSDIHLGSWYNRENVIKGLHMVQSLKADVIVFTGDLINVHAEETHGYDSIFRSLSALGGKYAVIGNHDLGDFARIDRGKNLGKHIPEVCRFLTDQHFNVLRNSSKFIYKRNDSIAIAGVDNWSASDFQSYGDIHKALDGINDSTFTILLTHDPSHWKAEVVNHDVVNLTLSGHTHGGQMGIKILGFQWSPIQYRYPEWNGLYEKAGHYLYVNPGMGFLSFSGRIGIYPEITLLRLHSK